jgi:hypothetical protein
LSPIKGKRKVRKEFKKSLKERKTCEKKGRSEEISSEDREKQLA